MRIHTQNINIYKYIIYIYFFTCDGKLTYFRASYWHQLLIIFDREQNAYLYNGVLCCGWRWTSIYNPDIRKARIRFTNTKNCESWNRALLPEGSSYSYVKKD